MGKAAASILVAIAGGTGAGKSWLADYLSQRLVGLTTRLREDWYYRDRSHLTARETLFVNFDHPGAIDASRLIHDLDALRAGQSITAPQYDYATHSRIASSVIIEPNAVILLEGLFVLHRASLRNRADIRVFIDVPADLRLARRVHRDSSGRRIPKRETMRLWQNFVCPMHDRFVNPSATHADQVWRPASDAGFPERLAAIILGRVAQTAPLR